MSLKIGLNDKKKFPFFDWKKVEEETKKHLEYLCSSHYRLITNLFPNKDVSISDINDTDFRWIEKKSHCRFNYLDFKEQKTEELIKFINREVRRILKELYLGILQKLISKRNKDEIISKFKLAEIDSLIEQEGKEIIWLFFHFLVKQKQLMQTSSFENLNQEWIVLVSPNLMLNFLRYGKLLLIIDNEFNQTDCLFNNIHFIVEPHLGVKNQLNQIKYDDSKIVSIFFPKWACIIKWNPINIFFDQWGEYINVIFRTKSFFEIATGNVYLFY